LGAHLLNHLGTLYLDGLFGNPKVIGHLLVEDAAHDKTENLSFPRG